MSTDATPTTPAATHFAVPKPLLYLLLLLPVGLGGLAAFQHYHPAVIHVPTPAPAPVVPPDFVPQSVIDGSFFPLASNSVAAKATPDDPATPLGLFRLDASTSKSQSPIQWQVEGPGSLRLRTYTPDDAPGHSLAEAEATDLGTYSFHGTSVGVLKGRPTTHTRTKTFTLTAPPPPPAPPVPPNPTPDPGPTPGPQPAPTPTPAPDKPAPIAGDGLRVLFVYESADLGKYPKDQVAALYSGAVRDYLDATSPKVGGVPEYRLFDKDADLANESKTWQDAMKRARESLPWIVVSNGKTGFEGPLPGNPADTLALVRKYGDGK